MTAPRYIQRAPHDQPYVTVPNTTAQDERLTWGARGMLLYLLSMPPDWRVRQADLEQRAPEGRRVVQRYLRELEDVGYLRRDRQLTPAGTDLTTWVYALPEGEQQAMAGCAFRAPDPTNTRESGARSVRPETRAYKEHSTNTTSKSMQDPTPTRAALVAALREVFGDATTHGAKSLLGKVASSLADAGATPEQVRERGAYMLNEKGWPAATAAALEKHWDAIGRELAGDDEGVWWDKK